MPKTRPEFCTEEMLEYLDDLRESGVTNMFGAAPYLDRNFPELEELTERRSAGRSTIGARDVLTYWMDTFAERHGL